MNELKRYDFYADGDCINDGGCGSRCETPHGEYVDYNEAAALLDEKDKEIARLREALNRIVALGHNDDCMFCGFKDKQALATTAQAERQAQDTTEKQIAFATAAFSQELPEEMKPAQGGKDE